MAINANEVRVAANGSVNIADKGTALPTDLAALAVGYKNVGYLSEDGATLKRSVSTDGVPVWQSTAPVRYLITGTEMNLQFAMAQFNKETLGLYFGGNLTITETTAGSGIWKFNLDAADTVDERALVLEAIDGAYTYRYCFARTMLSDQDDIKLTRKEASVLGVSMGIMPDSSNVLGVVITNDPAFTTP